MKALKYLGIVAAVLCVLGVIGVKFVADGVEAYVKQEAAENQQRLVAEEAWKKELQRQKELRNKAGVSTPAGAAR